MTSSEAKERAAAREVDRKRTGRLGDDSVIRPSVLYTNSEVKTHPPAAAPSKLIKDLVKFDHGCLKYTVAPCKPSSSPLLNKNTAVLLGLLWVCKIFDQLQQRGNRHAIICGSRRARHGVVMCRKEDTVGIHRGCVGAIDLDQDI